MVIWLCGLSGSGKTTLGRALYQTLKQELANVVLLDGDELRQAFGHDLGHDAESRRKNSIRIANFCQLLDRQNIHVICCAMTIAIEAQVQNRARISHYYEILLDVKMEVLQTRDYKGIYTKAQRGELKDVCGVDLPFIPPVHPDLVLDNNKNYLDHTALVQKILALTPFASKELVL